jgi:F420 biosynthesis protein FbiB-like protein
MVADMTDRFERDLSQDSIAPQEVRRRIDRGRERLLAAPIVIVLCMTMEDMDRYTDERRSEAERTMAMQSVALAAGHILLGAHAIGLGACWLCAPLFAHEQVRSALDLPPSWEPQGAIVLGYPAEVPKASDRRPIDEVCLLMELEEVT